MEHLPAEAKADAVREVLDDPTSLLPAALAVRGAALATVIVDPAAARASTYARR